MVRFFCQTGLLPTEQGASQRLAESGLPVGAGRFNNGDL